MAAVKRCVIQRQFDVSLPGVLPIEAPIENVGVKSAVHDEVLRGQIRSHVVDASELLPSLEGLRNLSLLDEVVDVGQAMSYVEGLSQLHQAAPHLFGAGEFVISVEHVNEREVHSGV